VKDVLGIGNAIVDVLVQVDDAFLDSQGLAKGGMTLVDEERAEAAYALVADAVECSGGSAANTMVGLASMGGTSAYIGKVLDDGLGQLFARDLRDSGCAFDTAAATSGPSTGRCLVLVTQDAQRTMLTYLGASATLGPDDIDSEVVRQARVTYLEGYLWDPPLAKQAFRKAAEIAHAAGRKVALSLSDSFCVDRHRGDFRELVSGHVDLLFANETEILSLYETTDLKDAVAGVSGDCDWAALTLGEKGSLVVSPGATTQVDAQSAARVVDTTGAGDLYASGFLFGWVRGMNPESCARLGGIAAAEVISHFGARPQIRLADAAAAELKGAGS